MASETAQPGFWSRVQRASVERLHIRLESLLVLVALSAVMAVLSPYFLSLSNFLNILLATSTIGVLAIAATFVIGSGGLDLSLGSVMGLVRRRRRLRRRQSRLVVAAGGCRLHHRRRHCRLHQRPAGHPRLRAGLHRHARHARPGARAGAGHLAGQGDLRPAARDRLYRPGPAVRHADAGHPPGADGDRRALRCSPIRALAATRWRSATARVRRAPPAFASSITAASSTRCRARLPASPACCSPRASMPATRPPASTTSSPPSPRRSSAAPTCSAAAPRSSAP